VRGVASKARVRSIAGGHTSTSLTTAPPRLPALCRFGYRQGAVDTELPGSITEPDMAQGMRGFCQATAIPAEPFARAVAFAIEQPDDVDVNEIVFRPTRQVP
jgi:hypothetical protein